MDFLLSLLAGHFFLSLSLSIEIPEYNLISNLIFLTDSFIDKKC